MNTGILGNMDARVFLADYWQRKPLLIKQALHGFKSPLTPDELAGLSLEEPVESRIVINRGSPGEWQLFNGPFTEDAFQNLPQHHWTLLVQGVDLWCEEVAEILDHFDFLPRWRIDDIMVSFAADSGGVGPHCDNYDVFLLQGYGRRRWQIGDIHHGDEALTNNPNLRILAEFEPREEWVLEPGDMLYLPPGIAHNGVAVGDSMTYSIGFRAPLADEILADLATELLARDQYRLGYRDPPLTPEMATDEITGDYIDQVQAILSSVVKDRELLAQWFARYMTAPKYPELDPDIRIPPRTAVLAGGIKTRYVNGEPES